MILKFFARRLAAALLLGLLAFAPASATVNSAVNKTIALGNGITTTFNFSFIGVAAAYISVILTDASGNETVLTQGSGTTQYQITLNAPVTGAIWGLGGSITYNPSGTPIPAGSTLTIFRTLPLTQAISLQNQNSLARLGNGAETGLDIGVMQGQQISEDISRAIKAPIVDATPPADLPPIAQRANKGAAFDSAGNLVAGTTPASGVISSAMQPVVNAATLALGRTAFGLGGMATENIGAGLQDDGAGSARVIFALQQVATNQAIAASAHLNKFEASGALTFTLARANTLWSGFGFWIDALSGPVTLTPNANDTIVAQTNSSGASVTIPTGASVFVKTNGAASGSWWIEWQLAQAAPTATASVVNLTMANNAGTPNTKIDVSFNSAVLTNGSGAGLWSSGATVTLDATTVGLNGLDTGTLAASTWYYAFGISNGGTFGTLLSLSSTAPTMPGGYTFKKYLGAVRTDASVHFLRTLQLGRKTQYKITAGSNTATMPQIFNGTTAAVMIAASVANIVPPTATDITVSLQVNGGAGPTSALAGVAPSIAYGTTIEAPGAPALVLQPGANQNGALLGTFGLEGTNIGVFSSGALVTLYGLGWTDNLI